MAVCLVVVVLSLCNSIALALAPLSMIAPFAGVSMVWSVWFGHCGVCGISEPLTLKDVACTVLILCGVLVISITESIGKRRKLTHADLLHHASNPAFVIFWMASSTMGIGWLLLPTAHAIRERHPLAGVFISALLGASAAALTESFVKLAATAVALASTGMPPLW